MNLRSAVGVLALAISVGSMGCADDGYKTTDLSGRLEVQPLFYGAEETWSAGWDPVPFSALVDASPVAVTWESSDPTVASISAAGVAQPHKAGFTAITATQGATKKSASLTVTAIPGTLIVSGVPVAGVGGAQGAGYLYRILLPAGTTSLSATLSGGTGDIDLYVRKGEPASPAAYDSVSWNAGNGESVVVANPAAGRWFFYLDVYAAAAGATFLVTVTP